MKTFKILAVIMIVSTVAFGQGRKSKVQWSDMSANIKPTLTELNYLVGVTDTIQEQLNNKVDVANADTINLKLYAKRLETVTNARIDHTGTTNETTLVTISIPAGALGPNGEVRIWFLFSATNSATNKVIRLKDQSSYVLYSSGNVTTTVNGQVYTWIRNRNSLTAQVAPGMSTFGNLSGAAPIVTTHNSALGLTFTLTGQCSGSASDHIYIESIIVEYTHGGN